MSISNYTENQNSFVQPATGQPCKLKEGTEDQVITLLRVIQRLEYITDANLDDSDEKSMRRALRCCQQQHEELALWATELLIPDSNLVLVPNYNKPER